MSTLETPIEELRPTDLNPARSPGDRLSAILAFFTLVGVDVIIRFFGFRKFHGLVRNFPRLGKSADQDRVKRICTAVDRAAAHYFKRAWCLQRSATATCLLRLFGIQAEMVIGAKKIPFYAHAWVEVEGRVVNDHPMIQQRYTVMERF